MAIQFTADKLYGATATHLYEYSVEESFKIVNTYELPVDQTLYIRAPCVIGKEGQIYDFVNKEVLRVAGRVKAVFEDKNILVGDNSIEWLDASFKSTRSVQLNMRILDADVKGEQFLFLAKRGQKLEVIVWADQI